MNDYWMNQYLERAEIVIALEMVTVNANDVGK